MKFEEDKVHVHILRRPEDPSLAILKNALDGTIHLTFGEEVPDGVEVLVAGRPARAQIDASAALHTVVVPWAGIPEGTRALLLERPNLALHNLHFPAVPVAESALALLLAAAKHIVPADRALRRGDWTVRYTGEDQGVLLRGKTALILGLGAIGRPVAAMCQSMGMHVLATRRSVDGPTRENGVEVHPPDALHGLLPRADALIICLPLTPETQGLIGAHELALLPPRALLVNVGRGPVVVEEALYHALAAGTLHAAGLDVWYSYPKDKAARANTPPSAYPFHELDNVVMSPHRTNATDETERLRMEALAALLNAIAQGDEVPNRVDVQTGY